MQKLSNILHKQPHEGEMYSTDDKLHGLKCYWETDVYRAIEKWLKQFKDYLPSVDASDHAKGAHDAINDLESWIKPQKEDSPVKS